MEKIHEYFDTYYVPNNMAIILSGDFDPDQIVPLVEKYWGKLKAQKVPKWKNKKLQPLSQVTSIDVFGKEKSSLQIGWRLPGIGSIESLKAQLIGGILFNQKAGLIDINLIQKQNIGQKSSCNTDQIVVI